MNGDENNKLTAFLEKTRRKELVQHTLKEIEKIFVYVKLLIKESSFIQTFNYKLPLRKEFSPLNRHFRRSSKYKRLICDL